MSQVALTVPNPLSGANALTFFQNMFNSLASSRSGTSAPVDVQAGEIWFNITTGNAYLRLASGADMEVALAVNIPTTLPASDVSSWAKASTKPSYTATEVGAVASVKVGTTSYSPSSGVVSIPAYPTTLPASDVSAWAKASSKPSYAYSEITNAPASLPANGGTATTANNIPTSDIGGNIWIA